MNYIMYDALISFIRSEYGEGSAIPLHEPYLDDTEKAYVQEVVESSFVSSISPFVDRFEQKLKDIIGSNYAIATVNGTSALHACLLLSGVKAGDLVITQPLTFVATCNAIAYCGAAPVFLDVDKDNLSLSPEKLEGWLKANAEMKGGVCVEKSSGKVIRACVPVHTLGHAARAKEIQSICERYNITMVEDVAEALGTKEDSAHVGLNGTFSVLSFNGNKVATAGGGGAILTQDESLASAARHITTTAKVADKEWFFHDQVGYNYRMPGINAALGLAQLEKLELVVKTKRVLAEKYQNVFKSEGITFFAERQNTQANYWLNTVFLDTPAAKESMLNTLNDNDILARPLWTLMTDLPMFKGCMKGDITNAIWAVEHAVCLPSSAKIG